MYVRYAASLFSQTIPSLLYSLSLLVLFHPTRKHPICGHLLPSHGDVLLNL
jgi:hypothetical protein